MHQLQAIMKNKLLLTVCVLATLRQATAQTTETIKIAAGNDIAAAVSVFGIFRLPAFVQGTVFFKDGKIAKESLNYHILNDQILYVNKTADTLAIALPEEIKKVEIDGIVFYYEKKGWLEGVADAGNTHLVIKRKISIHYEKEGAFGISNSTNGIDSYTTFTSNNSSYHLVVSEDAAVKKSTSWWLLPESGQPFPANSSGFLNVFAKNRKAIDSYLDSHKVNFNKEADLRALLAIAGADH